MTGLDIAFPCTFILKEVVNNVDIINAVAKNVLLA